MRVLAWVVMAVVVSGCTQASKNPDQEVSAPAGLGFGDGGIVEGLVLDEEQLPIGGARVGLVELGREARTDDQGAFAFGDVPVGTHRIAADHPAAATVVRSVVVTADERTRVVLILPRIRLEEPATTLEIQDGLISCGISTPIVTMTEECNDPGHKSEIPFAVSAGLRSTVLEATWTSSSALTGKELLNQQYHDGKKFGDRVQSTSPLTNRHPEAPTIARNGTLVEHFYVGFSSTNNPVVLAYQQHFRAYFSAFYYMDAPDGYSGMP